MNRLFLLFAFAIFSVFSGFASTQINTPNVNGTWTLAGSPYYINTNVSITYNAALIIEPGVEIIFTGYYGINSDGILKCVGTNKDRIIFRQNDTTGWSNDNITAGGWAGIISQGNYNNPNGDSTKFAYCTFRDAKKFVMNVGKDVIVDHCEFYHNRSAQPGGEMLITLGTVGMGKYRFTNCSVHDNYANAFVVYTGSSDSVIVTNNVFDHNLPGSTFANAGSKVVFTNNTLSNNTCSQYNAPVQLINGTALVADNKIFKNNMERTAALSVQSNKATIERNLICNNSQVDALSVCGISDGGGGILLFGRNMTEYVADRSIYIVRNNVIANNYSKLGGGAIATRFATSYIVNNTIVNNTSESQHAAFFMWGEYSRVQIKNNIISGNKSVQTSPPEFVNFGAIVCDSLFLGYNLMDKPFYQSHVSANTTISYLQDTATNIIDPVLHLASPTTGAGLGFDASISDFSLVASSTNCINHGSNAALHHDVIDYHGNQRIVGSSIDIGATEFSTGTPSGINTVENALPITVYPNPCQDKLSFELDRTTHQVKSIAVVNMLGSVVNIYMAEKIKNNIDISPLANGVYFLQIHTNNGKLFQSKFVVDHR
jgi:hypothetical protein